MARWDYNQRESLRRTQFWVSGVCNNDCAFCLDDLWKPGHAGAGRPDLVIGLDRLDAFLAERERANEVCLTGPDPGTCRDLVAIVARVRELGFSRVAIMTNGRTLGRPGVADALVGAGVTRFEVSLHGGQAEVHDAATRRPGSFVQSMQGLQAALAARNAGGALQVEVVTVVYRGNLPALDATVGTLLATGPDRLSVNLVEPWGEALTDFDQVVPALPQAASALAGVLKRFGARARLTVDGVPPCLLQGLEGFAGNREAIDLAEGSGARYAAEASDQGRAFGVGCASCLHRPVCTGVYAALAERHGFEALQPVRVRDEAAGTEAERRGLLALFYDRWEKRYRARRLEAETGHVRALAALLPAGTTVALSGSDPLGARVRLGGIAARLRVTRDPHVPVAFRVGAFAVVPERADEAAALARLLA